MTPRPVAGLVGCVPRAALYLLGPRWAGRGGGGLLRAGGRERDTSRAAAGVASGLVSGPPAAGAGLPQRGRDRLRTSAAAGEARLFERGIFTAAGGVQPFGVAGNI